MSRYYALNWRKTVVIDKIKTHTEWVAEQVARARENGIREGLENMTAAQLIAALYHECAKLAARVADLEELQDLEDLENV